MRHSPPCTVMKPFHACPEKAQCQHILPIHAPLAGLQPSPK